MHEKEDIHELLYRYLIGETTEDENTQVAKLLEVAEHLKEFEKIKSEYSRIGEYRGQEANVDVDKAWLKVSDRLGFQEKKDVKVIPMYNRIPVALRYAAVVIVLLGAYFFFKPADEVQDRYMSAVDEDRIVNQFASNESIKKVDLPEGSKITLKANSEIQYSFTDSDSLRQVKLNRGEAYFEIERDETRPFIVETPTSFIRVLGTKFTVELNDSGHVEVAVTEGVVRLYSDSINEETPYIDLFKGQKGKRSDKGLFRLESGSWNAISWLTGNLRFNEDRMKVVLDDIQKHYQVNIVVEDTSIYNCTLTAKFKKQEIKEVMESLKLTFGIEYQIIEDQIIIKGRGC